MTQDITLDFETYYDSKYSLRKMTTREYIMDDRFEVHLLAVIQHDGSRLVLDAEEIPEYLAGIDWANTRLSAHNMKFDGAILKWRYGYTPKLYECTMSMAQAAIGHLIGGSSLDKVNTHLGRVKDSQALMNMMGRPLLSIDRTSEDWLRYKRYAGQDAEDCRFHLRWLRPAIPEKQRLVIHILMRMYIEGQLELDMDLLQKSLADEEAEQERLLARAGIADKKLLTSRDKFASILQSLGVTVPQKVSERTGKLSWAMSKKDLDFVALEEHESPLIRGLVEARLNASSSLSETRTRRFIRLASIPGAKLHVPLIYSGAHTHRFSGADSINLQNLPRGSALRYAIKAPKGYKIVVVDASQIEARIVAWLAGAMELLDAFAKKKDVYSAFASKVFGFEVTKKDYPGERFIGKTCILGLGYGTGRDKLWQTLNLAKEELRGREISPEFAAEAVDTYRKGYPEIPTLWKRLDSAIVSMAAGRDDVLGPVTFASKRWTTCEGLNVVYPELQRFEDVDPDTGLVEVGYRFWRHRYKSWAKIYGAALTENIVQHLAWLVITDAMVRMHLTNPEWLCVMQVHDELVYLVREDEAQTCYDHLMKFMRMQPSYAACKSYPIPLDAEGDIADSYGDAK